jgi:mono/diheme cytochrome c family protein
MTRSLARIAILVLSFAAARADAQRRGGPPEKQVPIQKDPPMPASIPAATLDGKQIYALTCIACHQVNGEGLPDRYPPLAESEWVQGDERRLLAIVLRGLTGEIEVQGEMVSGAMPGWAPLLNDTQVAAVASYVRSSFGNKAPPVTSAAVARVRTATASRKTPYTVGELPKP